MDTGIRELERKAVGGDPQAIQKLIRQRERADGFDSNSIQIDGEFHGIDNIQEIGEGIAELTMGDVEYVVALDSETAGQAARDRWEEMARFDPAEFTAMVGEQTLCAWALGQAAGPGYSKVHSLNEWLDLWLDTPEEEWGRYEGTEVEVERVGSELAEELGFVPTVAYRC